MVVLLPLFVFHQQLPDMATQPKGMLSHEFWSACLSFTQVEPREAQNSVQSVRVVHPRLPPNLLSSSHWFFGTFLHFPVVSPAILNQHLPVGSAARHSEQNRHVQNTHIHAQAVGYGLWAMC